jgi:DNA-binding transcriptional LysR family regulator
MPNNKNNPSLNDLSVFLAVSTAGGFRLAAKRLGMSPSTVSETVSRLEAGIGTPLFTRTTRSVMPTDAGRVLAERLAPILAEAGAAVDDAASMSGGVHGLLKLNVPGAVMVDILPPLIDRFLERHPDARLEVMVDDRLVDVTAAGCHAGIRYGEYLAQDMIAIPIGPRRQWGALAASPSYLARRGEPTHPRDLSDHDCIRTRFSSGALTEWSFMRDGEQVIVDPPGRLTVGTAGAAAAIGHAKAGQGLIMTFLNWLAPSFSDGSLRPVLSDWWAPFDGPHLYFSSRFMPAPLRAFITLVEEEGRHQKEKGL